MDTINNALLVRRAIEVGEVLKELAAVEAGPTDWFSEYPRDLRTVLETGLCLTIVSMKELSATKALRYVGMLARGTVSEEGEDAYLEPCDEEWSGDAGYAPLDAYLYVGPPEVTLFYERTLSPARVNYVLAYEAGGYLADLLSYNCAWSAPRARQCTIVWDALDPSPAQHELWLDLRALPRVYMAQPSDFPHSVLDLTVPQATATEIVARELLAPWSEISAIFCAGGGLDRHWLVSLLTERYGLPAAAAARYCNDLRTLLTPESGRADQSAPPGSPPSPAPSPSMMQTLHWGEEVPDEPEGHAE